uniref:Putative secreted protein n=1 Tax=Anopheles marajoara TaxID=58244 RepID=A0A2M4CDH3_9DIPT
MDSRVSNCLCSFLFIFSLQSRPLTYTHTHIDSSFFYLSSRYRVRAVRHYQRIVVVEGIFRFRFFSVFFFKIDL